MLAPGLHGNTNLSKKLKGVIVSVATCVFMWLERVCPAISGAVAMQFTCSIENTIRHRPSFSGCVWATLNNIKCQWATLNNNKCQSVFTSLDLLDSKFAKKHCSPSSGAYINLRFFRWIITISTSLIFVREFSTPVCFLVSLCTQVYYGWMFG